MADTEQIDRIAARFFERAQQFNFSYNPAWSHLIDYSALEVDNYKMLAAEVLYGKFPLLETVADLEYLPVGSVVVGADGWWALQSDYHGPVVEGQPRAIEWASAANWFATNRIELPATLISVPAGTL